MTTITLSPRQAVCTFESMERHGGGFCRALAHAWYKADPGNKRRIEAAFPHLLEDFGPGSSFYTEDVP
jgi:hypothetical protein